VPSGPVFPYCSLRPRTTSDAPGNRGLPLGARYDRDIGKRAKRRKKARRHERRSSLRERFARLAKQLFGGTPDFPPGEWGRPAGGVGVREPLHPRRPTLSGAVSLDEPPPELRDVRAVADG
jgi:hypothetical protein